MPANLDSLFDDDDFNFDDSFEDELDDDDIGIGDGPQETNFESMFRETSSRSESYDDSGLDNDEYLSETHDTGSERRGLSLGGFTPFQMIILMMLVLLDFAAIGFGILVLMGRIA